MLDRFTVGAALELRDDGIAVNTLAPEGAVATENAKTVAGVRDDQSEPMETMVEAAFALCTGDPKRAHRPGHVEPLARRRTEARGPHARRTRPRGGLATRRHRPGTARASVPDARSPDERLPNVRIGSGSHVLPSVPRRRDLRDLQHRAGTRARGRGFDVDLVQGRARRARRRRAVDPRRRRRRRPVRPGLRVPGPAQPGVDRRRRGRGSRRCCRRRPPSPRGWPPRVLIIGGAAGVYIDRASTAPWTRPSNEFVAPFGMFTAAEFALMARRHMHMYGTTPDALATVAATIRNNGHVNPEAVYHGRGPFTTAGHPRQPHGRRPVPPPRLRDDVRGRLRDRADPRRPRRRRVRSVRCTCSAATATAVAPSYKNPPAWDLGGNRRADLVNGTVGRRAAEDAFRAAGLGPTDVDVCEFYDPFSFEIIRQFEAFGFCGEGEGGDFVMGGTIEPGGQYPVTTDGGVMSFSHAGASCQMLQRVIRGVRAAARHVRDHAGRRRRGRDVLQRRFGRVVHRRDVAGSGATVTRARNRRPARSRVRIPGRSRSPTGTGARAASCCSSGAATAGMATHTPAYLCSALHVAGPHVGAERGHRRDLQLDHGVAPADPVVHGALRRDHRRHGRGLADPVQPHRVRARRGRDRHAGRGRVPRDGGWLHAARTSGLRRRPDPCSRVCRRSGSSISARGSRARTAAGCSPTRAPTS